MLNIPKFNVIDVSRNCSDIGSIENKPRSGRPKNKPRDYRQLERIVMTNRRSLSSILLRNYVRGDRILWVKERISISLMEIIINQRGVFKKKSKQLVGCTWKRQWTVNDRKRVMFKMNPRVWWSWRKSPDLGKKCQYLEKKDEWWRPDVVHKKKTEQTKFEVTIWDAYAGKVWELRPRSKEI